MKLTASTRVPRLERLLLYSPVLIITSISATLSSKCVRSDLSELLYNWIHRLGTPFFESLEMVLKSQESHSRPCFLCLLERMVSREPGMRIQLCYKVWMKGVSEGFWAHCTRSGNSISLKSLNDLAAVLDWLIFFSGFKMSNDAWLGALELATMWMFDEVGHPAARSRTRTEILLRYGNRPSRDSMNTSCPNPPRRLFSLRKNSVLLAGSRPRTRVFFRTRSKLKNSHKHRRWTGKRSQDFYMQNNLDSFHQEITIVLSAG